MKNITARESNPFGFSPPCESFVPGFGDANAHFHVIGDHPRVHGGADSGIPFTEFEASERFQGALVAGGLLTEAGTPPVVDRTYFSYLHTCVPEGVPSEEDYADQERFFDAELRAITAHVLLPVGARATSHVFAIASARSPGDVDMDALHATELPGSGWLILPIKDPAEWTGDDEADLIAALEALLDRDYRREADLGRFLPDDDPYLVR
ncbi:uracil-DNA glycosylase [Halobacteriales archaeon QS_4_69_31]|nr:MAG: uracil-DNA glycosylase [Halobacteriales archaeon QS_4_69_31]